MEGKFFRDANQKNGPFVIFLAICVSSITENM